MTQFTIQQTFDLAVQHHQAGRLRQADQLYRQILSQQPAHIGAIQHLGLIAHQVGRSDLALDFFRRAIALDSSIPQAHNNLGNALAEQGQLDDAIAAYRQAIALKPDYADAHNNLGLTFTLKGQFDEAFAAYRQALSLSPNLPQIYSNFGNALREMGQLDEAAAAHRQSIALRPNYAEGHSNLGTVLKDQGQLDEAIAAYRQAMTIRPGDVGAHDNLLVTLHYHPAYDAQTIAGEHRRWAAQHAQPLKHWIHPHTNDRNPNRRLRIGYVSTDFRAHPVGRFLVPLLANHDHGQFEIYCYSSVRVPDELTSRLRCAADVWRDIHNSSDEMTARLIHDEHIDILVDLAMHMAGNRMLMFARKPAPVQISYLAYCGTTGLETIDYRISDPYLDPPEMDESIYSEQTVRLPHSYWCYEPSIQGTNVSALPAIRAGRITFGCLNNFCKISSPAMETWAKMLRAIPLSRLMIHTGQGSHRQRLVNELAQRDVNPARVHFVEKLPLHDYLRHYNQIDIALDPFPFVGGATTCDALWMGVPVVTLRGPTATSRGGVSILSNIGLHELIADTPEQYIKIAADLANDLPRLSHLRSTLRDRMLQSPLMDARQFARDMETIYRQVWQRWCASGN
jgi:protein O-GlcNAc transferase